VGTSWFAAMFTLMSSLDKTRYIDFLGPIIMVVLPIVCIIINALAITHVGLQKEGRVRQFNITIKVKIWNILLILLSLVIVGIFIAYVMTENISISN